MRRDRTAVALVVGALLAGLVGCASQAPAGATDDRLITSAGENGMEPLLEGATFEVVDGCVLLRSVLGAEAVTWLPVFPEGTSLDDDGSLVAPSGLVVAPGEPFDVGGGAGSGVPDHAAGGACRERTEDVWLVSSEF